MGAPAPPNAEGHEAAARRTQDLGVRSIIGTAGETQRGPSGGALVSSRLACRVQSRNLCCVNGKLRAPLDQAFIYIGMLWWGVETRPIEDAGSIQQGRDGAHRKHVPGDSGSTNRKICARKICYEHGLRSQGDSGMIFRYGAKQAAKAPATPAKIAVFVDSNGAVPSGTVCHCSSARVALVENPCSSMPF